VIVTTPEEMPVAETIELRHAVAEKTTVELAAVVVNRVLPERFSPRGEAAFEAMTAPGAMGALRTMAGDAVDEVVDAARLATTLRRSRTRHLATLRDGLDPTTPVLLVPYLFQRADGLRATHQLAEYLAEELGQ
jgi:anion-transporting  ArsA/GET3 family ATPase